MKYSNRCFAALCGAAFLLLVPYGANLHAVQEDTVSSKDVITEERVKETVSFLASDEMAGRDTPSPELQKACDYVEGKFKSWGLEGAGDDGTLLHTTSIPTVQYAVDEVKLTDAAGSVIPFLGLLAAGDEKVSVSSKPTVADAKDAKGEYGGLVYVDFKSLELEPRQKMRAMNAALRRLQVGGAKAVVAKVGKDNLLLAQAKRMGKPQMVNARRRINIPVLLVADLDVDQVLQLEVPAPEYGDTEVHNVMGMIRGSDETLKEEAVIFSAHLDHIGVRPGAGDTVYNGADDNATGVTAVLMLAKAYAAMERPKRTVIFMTFWGEEKGLLGSKKFVERPTWPLDKIVANINIEMVGRPEGGANGKCWMTGWEHSDLGSLMADGAKSAGVEIFNHPKFSAMLYRASDNASFNARGVIAHSFSAGSLHSDYHQVGDEVEKLDIPHMTKVIRGLLAGSLPIANGEKTPAKTSK